MNLGDVANLGQIVGAIGVMVTLVYRANPVHSKKVKRQD